MFWLFYLVTSGSKTVKYPLVFSFVHELERQFSDDEQKTPGNVIKG